MRGKVVRGLAGGLLVSGLAMAGGGAGVPPSVEAEVSKLPPQNGHGRVQVRVTSTAGRPLWQKHLMGEVLTVTQPSGGRVPGWGRVDGALWVAQIVPGGRVYTLGFRLSDGRLLWKLGTVYAPLVHTGGELLFEQRDPILAYPDLREKELVRVKTSTGEIRRLNLRLPARETCGDINDYSYEALESLKTWADPRFFYAQHRDACGAFVARFDWHGAANQLPLITPK